MDNLVKAYLDYRHRDSGDGMPHFEGTGSPLPSADSQCVSLSEIELIDIFRAYWPCCFIYNN